MVLKRLASLFSPRPSQREFFFYVQCQQCGEVLRGRVDLFNELSVEYNERGEPESYFTRKVLVGAKRCYRPIEVELTFDRNRTLLNQEVKGGRAVSVSEYEAQQAEPGELTS